MILLFINLILMVCISQILKEQLSSCSDFRKQTGQFFWKWQFKKEKVTSFDLSRQGRDLFLHFPIKENIISRITECRLSLDSVSM